MVNGRTENTGVLADKGLPHVVGAKCELSHRLKDADPVAIVTERKMVRACLTCGEVEVFYTQPFSVRFY